jgi:hypothetical protein
LNDLIIKATEEFLPDHKVMTKDIREFMPEMNRACKAFMKRQSQFMDNLMTVHHHTPLRNLQQILAEMTQAKEALQKAEIGLRKKALEVEEYQEKLKSNEGNYYEVQKIELEIEERLCDLETSKGYVSGAIRRMANYVKQYNDICERYGIKNWTEEDFEREEERHHIMTAFDQALSSARAHGGVIDEGNHIYFSQIGVNGAAAQFYVSKFLESEVKLLQQGNEPSVDGYIKFLDNMAKHFQGCSKKMYEYKGMAPETNTKAMIK